MDATDDKVNLTGNIPTESIRPIRLGDAMISRPHICGFFNSHDDEYRTLLPFIKEGLECGEKAVHTIDPNGMTSTSSGWRGRESMWSPLARGPSFELRS